MSVARPSTTASRIYPAFCNVASPTFNKWVKLTAADVHGLRQEREWRGQNVFFHLNHPIRFVYLVGVILEIKFIRDWLVVLILDDGSGVTIDLKLRRVKPATDMLHDSPDSPNRDDSGSEDDASDEEQDEHESLEAKTARLSKKDWEMPKRTPSTLKPPHADTTISSVKVLDHCDDVFCEDLLHVVLNKEPLHVGSAIKAKGTPSVYRDSFQVELDKISLVRGADEEPRIWAEYHSFVAEVLCRPWILSDARIQELEEAADAAARAEREARMQAAERKREEDEKRDEHERREAERSAAKRKKIDDHERAAEERRQSLVPVYDGNALDRPDWKPSDLDQPERASSQRESAGGRVRPRKEKAATQDLRVQAALRRHAVRIGPG